MRDMSASAAESPSNAQQGATGVRSTLTRPGGPEDISSLGIYFRQMAAHDVMTAEEEQEAAAVILQARGVYWRELLSYPPFCEAVIRVIERTFDAQTRTDEGVTELLAALERASRNYRDRQTREHEDAYAHGVEALAQAMARLDTDGDASEPIAADLTAIMEGRRDLSVLEVTFPPKGSAPFRRYVERVERAGADLWRAKDRFVRANLRLVVTMARRYGRSQMALSDLIQEGNIGLLKAVDRFDPSRGFRFSTYASWWIRHAISRAIADKSRAVRVPVHMMDVHHKLQRMRQRFLVEQGRDATDEELAQAAGVPIEKIVRLRQCLVESGLSLDAPLRGAEGRTMGEMLEDESLPIPTDALAAEDVGQALRKLLGELRPIEADILRKRFGLDDAEPMTLREIGELYSLSRERIRQVQEQALDKIRRALVRDELA